MLVLSAAPWLASIGIISAVLIVGVLSLIVVAEKQIAGQHDPERASRLLTMKLRQPWKYLVVKWIERG